MANESEKLLEQATELYLSGRIDEADAAANRVLELDALNGGAYNLKGQCCLARRDASKAEAWFRRGVDLYPGLANLHFNLGTAIQVQGRVVEACDCLARALDLAPGNGLIENRLGEALLQAGRPKDAISHFRNAAGIGSPSEKVLFNLTGALLEAGELREAEETARIWVEQQPGNALAYSLLGRVLQQVGDFDGAARSFERALRLDRSLVPAYSGYVYSKRITPEDEALLERIHLALRARDGSSPKADSMLCYALGKANDDLGRHVEALKWFDRANALEVRIREQQGLIFDRDAYRRLTDWVIERSGLVLEHREDAANSSERPVFIVGMVRSGTTLVEQILSSHPEIAAGGELPFWRDRGRALLNDFFDAEAKRSAVRDYMEVLQGIGPAALRVTDKMPLNFMALAPIHALFPKARIIHCRRNPADTCLSIYVTPYGAGPEFAYRRENIAFAYREYLRLMELWRKIIPPEIFMEIDYEELVGGREAVSRSMIRFLGLEWNDACLHPERNAIPAATPSQWQVRQPIYRSSVGRYAAYEKWVPEFNHLS